MLINIWTKLFKLVWTFKAYMAYRGCGMNVSWEWTQNEIEKVCQILIEAKEDLD